jgi:hypothetical protein
VDPGRAIHPGARTGRPTRKNIRGVRSSTPYCTSTAPAASGGRCPMTSRPGTACTGTSAPGRPMALWTDCTTSCGVTCGKPRATRGSRRRRSSAANRSRRPKKGAEGLRRR